MLGTGGGGRPARGPCNVLGGQLRSGLWQRQWQRIGGVVGPQPHLCAPAAWAPLWLLKSVRPFPTSGASAQAAHPTALLHDELTLKGLLGLPWVAGGPGVKGKALADIWEVQEGAPGRAQGRLRQIRDRETEASVHAAPTGHALPTSLSLGDASHPSPPTPGLRSPALPPEAHHLGRTPK